VRSEEDLDRASLHATRTLVALSEADQLKDLPQRIWLTAFLEALQFSPEEIIKLRAEIQFQFSTDVKLVIAQTVLDLCTTLKERGYRLGIVSNWQGPLSEILRTQGLLDYFDSVITSHDAGVSKPNADIFRIALEDLDEVASKAIFIGDTFATDIIGAHRAGIQAILYDPLMKQLRALAPEDVSQKVVSLEALRHNRLLEGVKVIYRMTDLLEFLL
jgi:HAD superfamily hydrolase (TIGR01509 family)